jgi:hypothetical protein
MTDRRWLVVVVALAGCQRVYGLQEAVPRDAGLPVPDIGETATCEDPSTRVLDEDGDHVPNATDDCPGIYNVAQPDHDADGVGDACDPRPGLADHILDATYFETGFGCWTPDSVDHWTLAGGTATATGGVDAVLALPTQAPHATLEIQFEVPTFDTSVDNSMAFKLDYPGSTASCKVVIGPGGPYTLLLASTGTTYTQLDLQKSLNRDIHRIIVERRDGVVNCDFDGTTGQIVDPATELGPITVSLDMDRSSPTIYYAVVYSDE